MFQRWVCTKGEPILNARVLALQKNVRVEYLKIYLTNLEVTMTLSIFVLTKVK